MARTFRSPRPVQAIPVILTSRGAAMIWYRRKDVPGLILALGFLALVSPGLLAQGGIYPSRYNSVEPPLIPEPVQPIPRPQASPFEPRPAAAAEPPTPAVALHIRVAAKGVAGHELEYRIIVENTSQAAAHHVTVRNPIPAHAQYTRARPAPTAQEPELVWDLGTLAAGANREIVLVLTPTGTGDVRNCARVQFEHGQCVTTKLGRPDLKLEKRGQAQAILNDIVKYSLVVTNSGSADAAGVRVIDYLPEGLALVDTQTEGQPPRDGGHGRVWEVGTLTAGQSKTLEYRVRARATGTHRNEAAVEGLGIPARKTFHELVVTEPKLAIEFRGPTTSPIHVGVPVTYEIVVQNTGTAQLTNLDVTHRLPPKTTVQSSNGGRKNGDAIQWQLPTLRPGERRIMQSVVQAETPGEVRHVATVRADRGLADEKDIKTNFITFEEPVGVHLTVRSEEGNLVEINSTTRYTITVVNQGRSPVAKVKLVATAPDEMRVLSTEPKASVLGNKVTFEPFDLRTGATANYEVKVQALKAGEVHFQVDMNAEHLTKPVHHDRSTTIFQQ